MRGRTGTEGSPGLAAGEKRGDSTPEALGGAVISEEEDQFTDAVGRIASIRGAPGFPLSGEGTDRDAGIGRGGATLQEVRTAGGDSEGMKGSATAKTAAMAAATNARNAHCRPRDRMARTLPDRP